MSVGTLYGLDIQNIQFVLDDDTVGFILFQIYDPLSYEIYYEREFAVDTSAERLAAFQTGLAAIRSFLNSNHLPADVRVGFNVSA